MRSSTSSRSKLIETSFKVFECSKSKIFIFLFVFLSDLFYQKAFDESSFTLFSPDSSSGNLFRSRLWLLSHTVELSALRQHRGYLSDDYY